MPEGDAIKKQNYLSALPPSHNLKHIDWGITVNPAPERPAPKVPKVGETKIDFVRYLAQRKRKNVDEMALAEYRYILEAVSNQIIENFPSVESGVFWEYNYERSDPQGYRWSWTVIVNHDDQRQAIIDYDPLSFNTEFLRMRLGEEVEMDNDKEDANHYADHDLSEPVFVSEWEIDDTW
ncbi:uncharacterized protein L201_006741 [Kwoniella dendrophila CBS 6074]|uniref:Uncharacterized protein n=1 Tax=Kwoniella dendrophila CBS 6074 TaxID=1295534 RepID=A0AAX4K3W0_9TREE